MGNVYTSMGEGAQAARAYSRYLGMATKPHQKAAALLALGNAAAAGDARKLMKLTMRPNHCQKNLRQQKNPSCTWRWV